MQDVDFSNRNKVNVLVLLLWFVPVLCVFLFFSVSLFKNYSEVLDVNSRWVNFSSENVVNQPVNKSSDINVDLPNNNVYLSLLFDYFSNVDDGSVIIKSLIVNNSSSIKVSGEADNIELLSTFVDGLVDDNLFDGFGRHRLSVRHFQQKEKAILWSIEWLK